MPPGPHPDFAAAELLALVLGDAPSGRLHKRLTETQLAAGTFAFALGLAEPAFADPRRPARARAGCRHGARRAAGHGGIARHASRSAPRNCERAEAKWLKGWEQAFTNPETIGVALSESIAQGDWRLFFLHARPGARRDAGRRAARRDAVPAAPPTARWAPTCRPSKPARAPAPAARRRGAGAARTSSRDAAAGEGRGLRRHAGQHRRAHAALHGGRHEGGACCPRARAARGAGRR